MPVLVFCIIISFMLYLFYKTKYFRTNRPMEKGWLSGKSAMALGLFVALFGVNQFFLDASTVRIVVGILFIAFGGASIFNGFRQYKHFLPLAAEEAEAYKTM
ncbi:YtpI family protein [Bacillus sp. DX1.1]|uniref:YtpI family protein n=1 Tax=unclassified Bacillus (in: firmicutes) TaxID=185979 RepID=UPI0025701BB9|nr:MULTISPECIES: YtpI family protein [unclassified Bacillus (in: firmicutes)]MDM5156781.1 YtpI family protein [Bacillus sp. DX1.1]WJE81028.1 YtpI family protein [Bacillus sp. DX3.1]